MAVADINVLFKISHELNETLILMNHSLERLEHTYPELQCYQYWQDTKENCGYMKSLVARLSAWQQAVGYNRVPVDFEQLLHSLYLTCSTLPDASNKRIIYCCHRNIPIVYVMKKQVKSSLFSLICCRLNQCPENTCLRIDLNHINERIILKITDEGSLPSDNTNPKMEHSINQITNMAKQHNGNFYYKTSPNGGCVCILTFQVQAEEFE